MPTFPEKWRDRSPAAGDLVINLAESGARLSLSLSELLFGRKNSICRVNTLCNGQCDICCRIVPARTTTFLISLFIALNNARENYRERDVGAAAPIAASIHTRDIALFLFVSISFPYTLLDLSLSLSLCLSKSDNCDRCLRFFSEVFFAQLNDLPRKRQAVVVVRV